MSFVAISAIPPFPSFISEFILIKGLFDKKYFPVAILFFFLLTLILYGMGKSVMRMSFGSKLEHVTAGKISPLLYLPQVILLLFLLVMGLYMPGFIHSLLTEAANAFIPIL